MFLFAKNILNLPLSNKQSSFVCKPHLKNTHTKKNISFTLELFRFSITLNVGIYNFNLCKKKYFMNKL